MIMRPHSRTVYIQYIQYIHVLLYLHGSTSDSGPLKRGCDSSRAKAKISKRVYLHHNCQQWIDRADLKRAGETRTR
jgi:hypothetical protein